MSLSIVRIGTRGLCPPGMFNPTDGRIAYFALNGNLENSLSANGSIIIPGRYVVEGFVLGKIDGIPTFN